MPLSRQAIDLLRSRLPTDDADHAKQPDPEALIFATLTGAPLDWMTVMNLPCSVSQPARTVGGAVAVPSAST